MDRTYLVGSNYESGEYTPLAKRIGTLAGNEINLENHWEIVVVS